jgi:hypothetical protein
MDTNTAKKWSVGLCWGLVVPMVAGPAVTSWLSEVFKEMQPQV